MLPVLNGLGLGASAVVVGMLFGPSQTAGRLFDMVLGARVHPITVAVIASVMEAVSFAILALGGESSALVFSVLFGAGAGVGCVVRGSRMLALYGTTDSAQGVRRLASVWRLVP